MHAWKSIEHHDTWLFIRYRAPVVNVLLLSLINLVSSVSVGNIVTHMIVWSDHKRQVFLQLYMLVHIQRIGVSYATLDQSIRCILSTDVIAQPWQLKCKTHGNVRARVCVYTYVCVNSILLFSISKSNQTRTFCYEFS